MGKAKSGPLRTTRTCSLISMLTLTSSFFIVEIIVGYVTNSMALVADSFHMLSDVMSLVVGFLALRYSKKSQRTERNTFGWQRAEVLGALINAVFLVALCFSILVEAFKRLVKLEEIEEPLLVLIVGIAGLAVNVVGLCMLHGHGHSHGGISNRDGQQYKSEAYMTKATDDSGSVIGLGGNDGDAPVSVAFTESYLNDAPEIQKFATVIVHGQSVQLDVSSDPEKHPLNKETNVITSAQMNMRAVYLHVIGDALGSVIVIASALCIIFGKGDWTLYIDPVMSIVMVIIIMKSSVPLLKESALILLQTVPTHIKVEEVRERLLEQVEGVLSLHEFHVWQLAGDKIIASAHITCRSMAEYTSIANKVKDFFHNEGIHSTTIQPEFVGDHNELDELDSCVLGCGTDKNCGAQRCCPEDIRQRKLIQSSRKTDSGSTTEDTDEAIANV